MEERPIWYWKLSDKDRKNYDEETGRSPSKISYVAAILGITAGILLINSCDIQKRKHRNYLEQYKSLPTTNIVARSGDTESGLIRKFDKETPTTITEYVFEQRNGNNGQISAGKTYKVGISTNYPYINSTTKSK